MLVSAAWAQNAPVISLVANAEGENPVIAPNTWVEIKGTRLAPAGDTRIWGAADFRNNQLPTARVQLRGGNYFLPATEMLTAADSGTATTKVVYENYAGEAPVFSGGMRVTSWTNTSGNTWKATLPASTQYFENLFHNGARRLRPRLGASAGNTLGGYFRIANTVYLNAPGPPAAAPNPNCSGCGSSSARRSCG